MTCLPQYMKQVLRFNIEQVGGTITARHFLYAMMHFLNTYFTVYLTKKLCIRCFVLAFIVVVFHAAMTRLAKTL